MSKLNDILFRSATVPAHICGGWALPGGGRTLDIEVARTVASNLADMIGAKAPLKSYNPPVVLAPRKPRRASQIASNDLPYTQV